jgi:hypothetical protein
MLRLGNPHREQGQAGTLFFLRRTGGGSPPRFRAKVPGRLQERYGNIPPREMIVRVEIVWKDTFYSTERSL